MNVALSSESERYIAEAVAAGTFPSREAVLEAAITELRAAQAEIDESLRRCDEAIDELDAGLGVPWDPEEMKRIVRDTHQAAQQAKSNRAAG
jgi:Arc/MetJ-type ribon-helix-helix transcriptional regulator